MIILLSPAKRLDFESEIMVPAQSQPHFGDEANFLAAEVRKLSLVQLQNLMGISDKLADLNYHRFRRYSPNGADNGAGNTRAALFAFKGDAFLGLDAESLNKEQLRWAQDHLRILSGLYGALKPLDRIQAYRLEMGLEFRNSRGKDLYAFWGDKISDHLSSELKAGDGVLINLASNEYYRPVKSLAKKTRVISFQFKEIRDGMPRTVGFFIKKARGLMARYIIQNRLEAPEKIKDFSEDGYGFNPALSDGDNWVFTRG